MAYNNQYINNIQDYAKQNTPVNFTINEMRYNEVLERLSNKKSENKDCLIAVYTLFYSAVDLQKHVKTSQNSNLSYYILLADYIYSYCTELLYRLDQIKLLSVFSSRSKNVVIDILEGKNTDYFLDILIEKGLN